MNEEKTTDTKKSEALADDAPSVVAKPWNSKRFGGTGCPKLKDRQVPATVYTIHTTEGGERAGSAAGACAWFDNPASMGNAGDVADADGVIEFAPSNKLTWHAGGINAVSLSLEICGKAGQTQSEWQDAWSTKALKNAARRAAAKCIEHGIEVRKLTDDEIRACKAGKSDVSGFAGHVDVNRALGVKGGHWDPGPLFPWADFLIAVRGYIELQGGYKKPAEKSDEKGSA